MAERGCENEGCDASLANHRADARYCGDACRAAAWRTRTATRAAAVGINGPASGGKPKPAAAVRESAQPRSYPSWGGLNADEIVAVFIREFDAEEVVG